VGRGSIAVKGREEHENIGKVIPNKPLNVLNKMAKSK
jgi:hypothetical protein